MHIPAKVIRLARRGRRLVGMGTALFVDCIRSSYSTGAVSFCPLWRPHSDCQLSLSPSEFDNLQLLARHYLRHEFDILGSGWVCWGQPESSVGRLNVANRTSAMHLANRLSDDYAPIGWHRDERSDYEFPPSRWSRLIQPGPEPGVDIKVPWELARMHHLVQLALLAVDQATDPRFAKACETEIFDQIRDFVAANPPRFGVNWRVAMDVAIRAANWVLALSILYAHGRDISVTDDFLGPSLRDHGRFIIEYLEWDPHARGNHYLANICGLAFIASSLPSDPEIDGWLALATGELVAEGNRQIHPDGSGFEASTSYHRLSLDMLVHTLALLSGLDAERWPSPNCDLQKMSRLPPGFAPSIRYRADPFEVFTIPTELVSRLACAAAFTRAVSRPDGRALLIGDNDSGRFFKPCPYVEMLDVTTSAARYLGRQIPSDEGGDIREVGEQHGHLVEAIESLWGAGSAKSIDSQLVSCLSRGRAVKQPETDAVQRIATTSTTAIEPAGSLNALALLFAREIDLDLIELCVYPGWGLYLLRGDGLLLSFRCGPLGLNGTGNHDHNDQLAVTLYLDGHDWITDPGTYRYTADLSERDAYRSVRAHFAPRLRDQEAEPGSLLEGTWRLGDQAQAEIAVADATRLQGSHRGYGATVHRRVELFADRLVITDWEDGELDLLPLTEQYAQLNSRGCALPFCPDYGVRCA